MSKTQYQLVLQFPCTSMAEFDAVIELEEKLMDVLPIRPLKSTATTQDQEKQISSSLRPIRTRHSQAPSP